MHRIIPLLATLGLLAGCQPAPEPYTGWIGESPRAPEVNLSDYKPPERLGVFHFQGEMDFPEREMRLFRYRHAERSEQKMDVALYPLPPGWTELPAERAVAGHYGQVKQTMASRVSERHNSDVELVSEALRQRDELEYPVAEGVFRERTEDWARTLVLEVSARRPVFVRVTSNFPEAADQTRLDELRAATHAFLRQQDGAGSHGDS